MAVATKVRCTASDIGFVMFRSHPPPNLWGTEMFPVRVAVPVPVRPA